MSTAGFFDRYPRYLTTSDSETQMGSARLNLRHTAIIESNLDAIRGRRILDIASHDGRWSFAALRAGATMMAAGSPCEREVPQLPPWFHGRR